MHSHTQEFEWLFTREEVLILVLMEDALALEVDEWEKAAQEMS